MFFAVLYESVTVSLGNLNEFLPFHATELV